jgi:hypothetical protein
MQASKTTGPFLFLTHKARATIHRKSVSIRKILTRTSSVYIRNRHTCTSFPYHLEITMSIMKRRIVPLAFAFLLARPCAAFVTRQAFHRITSTLYSSRGSFAARPQPLVYQNDDENNKKYNQQKPHLKETTTTRNKKRKKKRSDESKKDTKPLVTATSPQQLTIPILSRPPGQGPIVLGANLILSSATLGQLQSLVEASYEYGDTSKQMIDAAPLVAVLDDSCQSGRPRYATLCAFVRATWTGATYEQELDVTDALSLQTELQELNPDPEERADGVTFALVGVGRALLRDFFYQVPGMERGREDDEGYLLEDDANEKEQGAIKGLVNGQLPSSTGNHVIMAKFEMLQDCNVRIRDAPSTRQSSVHAVNELSQLASKLQRLHEDRKRLTAEIKVSQASLVARSSELLQDHDGIGALFDIDLSKSVSKASCFKSDSMLHAMLNYGMGNGASSYSTLHDTTKLLMKKLEPYYSPERRASEEHYYELFSFASVASMDCYLEAAHMSWSLKCANTNERLQAALDWMTSHVSLLNEEAFVLSKRLKEYGNQCPLSAPLVPIVQ